MMLGRDMNKTETSNFETKTATVFFNPPVCHAVISLTQGLNAV